MPASFFEIRTCINCGLRYPIVEGSPFGLRCPHCLGETKVNLKKGFDYKFNRGKSIDTSKDGALAVLVDNIRSAGNVGSILRTADGFGFSHAYLCGITPTPENGAVTKTSLGAEDFVTWSHHKDAVKLVRGLKKEGWKILALEAVEGAEPISLARKPAGQTALILGSEVTGVDPELLDLTDAVYFIPMYGEKKSFNVANAFSIAAYALVKQG